MRTTPDRIRHAVGFETIGLLIAAPAAALLFDLNLSHAGPMALAMSIIATGWNFIYNILVDIFMRRFLGRLDKTIMERVWHAIGFEMGLLVMTLPLIAWWLEVSLLEALLIDIAFVVFYLVYAFVYNLIYDKVFPLQQTAQNELAAPAANSQP